MGARRWAVEAAANRCAAIGGWTSEPTTWPTRMAAEGDWSEQPGEGPGAWYQLVCELNGRDGTDDHDRLAARSDRSTQRRWREQALDRTPIPAPEIRLNPPAGQDQVVNVPTWMWIDPPAWAPVSATASAGAVTVTATATPTSVSWDMGNGDVVVCAGPGTPVRPSASEPTTSRATAPTPTGAARPANRRGVHHARDDDLGGDLVGGRRAGRRKPRHRPADHDQRGARGRDPGRERVGDDDTRSMDMATHGNTATGSDDRTGRSRPTARRSGTRRARPPASRPATGRGSSSVACWRSEARFAMAVLYSDAGERRPVLALAQPVAAGQVIEADDLREVMVATDGGVSTFPAGQRDDVVGRTAVGAARRRLAVDGGAARGRSALRPVRRRVRRRADGGPVPGRSFAPATGCCSTSSHQRPKTRSPLEAVRATVVAVREGQSPGSISATVSVAAGDAGAMATAAGQDRLIVVLAPR